MPWRVRLSEGLAVAAFALLARNGEECLRVGTSDGQQRARSTTRLLATLLPALQRAHRHAEQGSELALRQTSLLPCLGGGAVGDTDLAGLHFADGLEQFGAEVALGSRFKGTAVGMTWHRRALLQTARWVNYGFTGLRLSDAHNGMRALTRRAAAQLELRQPGMAHATEIIAQVAHHRLTHVEVPVTIRYTAYSMAKGQKLSNSVHILLDLLLRGLIR